MTEAAVGTSASRSSRRLAVTTIEPSSTAADAVSAGAGGSLSWARAGSAPTTQRAAEQNKVHA